MADTYIKSCNAHWFDKLYCIKPFQLEGMNDSVCKYLVINQRPMFRAFQDNIQLVYLIQYC